MSEADPTCRQTERVARPRRGGAAHLSWSGVGLAAAGGAAGTGLRHLVTVAVQPWASATLAIMGINVVGSFALGALLEWLSWTEGERPRAQRVRLLLGTGLLGGFTTYSALATDTVGLLHDRPGPAVAYGLGSVMLGAAAAAAGIGIARRRGRRRAAGGPG